MNRKNLTAAVLAGLAGAAGIAGTAQAVNMNPDGLGQVLIYPYYTTNGGNQTLISVVNTTENAKAVKIRFLEGFNSREVLDFNLYMSHHDVWTAAVYDSGGVATLATYDTTCTVPYLYEMGPTQFLNIAYIDNGAPFNYADGGPTVIERAAEGHLEAIEMATIEPGSETEVNVTHTLVDHDGDADTDKVWMPKDCQQLVDNWTRTAQWAPYGDWTCGDYGQPNQCANNRIDMNRNSGGLFGGGAVVNSQDGTMYSFNAQAIQGFDKSNGGLHREPGSIWPSLNSGNQNTAYIFFGVPRNEVETVHYLRGVGAVSSVFMHEHIMNEYTVEDGLNAATEWVITFPTKNFYVDRPRLPATDQNTGTYWFPTPNTPDCGWWMPGDPNPAAPQNPTSSLDTIAGWDTCIFQNITVIDDALPPFSELFNGKSCDRVSLKTWDREEQTFVPDDPGGFLPPVVSPSLPCQENCSPTETPFTLCYEVNVLRFGNDQRPIFHTPNFGTEESPYGLLLQLSDPSDFANGWGRIDLYNDVDDHMDFRGLVGLPVTGFAAMRLENGFVDGPDGGTVQAYYGGLFMHRGSVRSKDGSMRFIGQPVSGQ